MLWSCICLKAFVVSLVSVPVPGEVSFKLHLRRQQLPNLVSRPRGGCEVIVNGVIRFLRLLLTTARCTPHPPESKDHSSAATCWRWTCLRYREQRDNVRTRDSFQQWTENWKTGSNTTSAPPPSCHGWLNHKESECLQVVLFKPSLPSGEWEVSVWCGGHLSEVYLACVRL